MKNYFDELQQEVKNWWISSFLVFFMLWWL